MLHERGYFNQLANQDFTTLWCQEWKSVLEIGLIGEEAVMWETYIADLKSNHVRLRDYEDELL